LPTKGNTPIPKKATQSFQLFVIDLTAVHTERAIADLRKALDAHLPQGYHLEVVDLREHPERAAEEQLIVLPAVIRKQPEPQVRLTGSFADDARVAQAFGLSLPPGDGRRGA
jgi:circadian clock protein KaiB